jgi:hypothetical protein
MKRFLKAVAAGGAVLLVVFIGWPFILALAGVFAATYLSGRWRRWRAATRFRQEWHRQGKDVLLVYSNSPHWQEYIEAHWLPKWGARAVVLNWSERKTWVTSKRSEARLFRAFAGDREFNPLGIVVPYVGEVCVVRFWHAFRDVKHGKDRALRLAEAELETALRHTGRTV